MQCIFLETTVSIISEHYIFSLSSDYSCVTYFVTNKNYFEFETNNW